MRDLRLQLHDPQLAPRAEPPLPLGRYLVNAGVISQADLVHALELQARVDSPLGEIMVAEGLVERQHVLRALSRQHHAEVVDLDETPPDAALALRLPASLCLSHRVVPFLALGETLFVATSRPDQFARFRACLGHEGRRCIPVIAEPAQIHRQIGRLYGTQLAQRAETRVAAAQSCRTMGRRGHIRGPLIVGLGLCLLTALVFAFQWTITFGMILALGTLLMTTALKIAALWAQLIPRPPAEQPVFASVRTGFRLPKVSILVPLLKEKEIAGVLIRRLSRLTYPKSLLEVVLVLEESDQITRETISRTQLPSWMSVIEVPEGLGGLTTKPRALNYALEFCQGSIIGVWDAEDAPEPDQIDRVVNRFHHAPDTVVCLQGILDYYNARSNWISRCFTIEYATWWRMVIPGIARLGLIVPLGGTTLFFRRDKLEELGGWDAHNVTEDADLGVRLARHGYVTELLPSVTYEEANCRAWPWVKQRSRWLKGFLITWLVHMRRPVHLLRTVGFWRFMGLQTIFLATFLQFAAAPLMWSFIITLFGVTHPVEATLGTVALWGIAGVFILAEVINLSISMAAVSGRAHRHLMGWVLTLPLYFPLGALASYKALAEMISRPFYWDKTQHGVTLETVACDTTVHRLEKTG